MSRTANTDALRWRIGTDPVGNEPVGRVNEQRQQYGLLDEVVLGDVLHLERISDRPVTYWFRVLDVAGTLRLLRGQWSVAWDVAPPAKGGAK